MNKTRFLLVRHCEAEGNIYRRIHGLFDSDITPRGQQQLECLKRRLIGEGEPIEAVYSSRLRRAQLTAEAIAEAAGVQKIQPRYRFNEQAMGIFEDKSWNEIRATWPLEFELWQRDRADYRIPQGESEQQALERFLPMLFELGQAHPNQTVAVATHSLVLRALAHSLGETGARSCENTAINRYTLNNETSELRIERLNDFSHLPDDLAPTVREGQWKESADPEDYNLRFVHQSGVHPIGDSALDSVFKGFPGHFLTLGYARDCCVGGMVYSRLNEAEFSLDRVYIKKELRRRGYATQLLGEVLSRARSERVFKLEIRRAAPHADVVGFLAKNNFTYLTKPKSYYKLVR